MKHKWLIIFAVLVGVIELVFGLHVFLQAVFIPEVLVPVVLIGLAIVTVQIGRWQERRNGAEE